MQPDLDAVVLGAAAIRRLPAGSTAVELARAVLEAALPAVSVAGRVEWAVEVVSPAGVVGYRQPCRSESHAENRAAAAQGMYPGWEISPVWRRVSDWMAVPATVEEAG